MTTNETLRVAMIGTAFMGTAHSHAWRTAPHFFELPLRPELALLVGRSPSTTEDRAERLGWSEALDTQRVLAAVEVSAASHSVLTEVARTTS